MKACGTCKQEKELTDFNIQNIRTGKPTTNCKICVRNYTHEWYRKYKTEILVRRRAAYSPKLNKNGVLKRLFGISLADYNIMLANQKGGCKICCFIPKEGEKQLAVDHNHKTGKVRGLLCNNCNNGLGRFKDSFVLLSKALNYLQVS